MAAPPPASLDSTALSRRLGELAGHERQLQVEFLLHLEEFDRRRAWAEAGYPSLWEWCLPWKLELDHIVPAVLGGSSTIDNLRVCCRTHNQLHADHTFGRAHMELFRRDRTRTGEGAISRRSSGWEEGDDAPGHPGAP